VKIRTFLISALFPTAVLAQTQPPIQWQPISQWFINPGQVRLYQNNAIYAMVQVPPAGRIGPQTPRTWNTVDLTQPPYGVNSTAKVASLVCDLIITGAPINNNTNTSSADPIGADGWFPHIHLTFRSHGDPNVDPAGYVGDVETSLRGDGIRTNFSVLVPLYQGKFDWLADYDDTLPPWDGTNAGGPSYGVNCSLQAFGQ
jgi:hypothetical protein